MNYNKDTRTPISDAARFFNERKSRIAYEESLLNARPSRRSGEASELHRHRKATALVSMEHI